MATLSDRIMNIKNSIETELQLVRPHFRKIIKEDHMHNFAEVSESHFKLTVVSDEFTGRMLVERYRMINNILTGKLSHFIHALVLNARTIEE
jgi:BolA protein